MKLIFEDYLLTILREESQNDRFFIKEKSKKSTGSIFILAVKIPHSAKSGLKDFVIFKENEFSYQAIITLDSVIKLE